VVVVAKLSSLNLLRRKTWIMKDAWVAGLIVAAILTAGWLWKFGTDPRAITCPVCGCTVRPDTRTVARLENRNVMLCSVDCWLGLVRSGTRAELMQVTDFHTRHTIRPEAAFYAVANHGDLLTSPNSPERESASPAPTPACQPRILAFASQLEAQQYAATYNAQLLRLADLRSAVPPSTTQTR